MPTPNFTILPHHLESATLQTRRRLLSLLSAFDLKLMIARRELGLEIIGSEPVTFMYRIRAQRFMPCDGELVGEVVALVERNPRKMLESVELAVA